MNLRNTVALCFTKQMSNNINIELLNHSAIPLLYMHSQDIENICQSDHCTSGPIAVYSSQII